MTSVTRTRSIVIAAIVLSVAGVIAAMMLASRPTTAAMAGMDHGSGVASESTPKPAASENMAGMDHGAHATGHESPASDHHGAGADHDSGDMPGMDMATSSPTPTMSGDMPGMDHGSGHTAESTPTPPMSEDMPGMDHSSGGSGDAAEPGHGSGESAEAAPNRPLAPVLSAFGGGTSAVLLTAGFLRRKDRAAAEVKQAARAARGSQK